jgi:hypothetical protein
MRPKKENTLAGSHREDKSFLRYDDMKFPHCKIIDEHFAIHHYKMFEREKGKRQKKTPFWSLAT